MIPGETEPAMSLPRPFTRVIAGITIAARVDADDSEAASLRRGMSTSELLAVDSRPTARRAGFLTGRALIRKTIAAAAARREDDDGRDSAAPSSIDAVCSDCGGPHGRVRIDGYLVSVTHAEEVTAVAAVSEDDARASGIQGVGLDLETSPGGPEKARSIRVLLGEPGIAEEHAIRRWTEVEAVLKADGRGLRVSPDAVVITGDADGRIARVSDRPGMVFEIREVDIGSGFVASLAMARREF